MSAWKNTTGPLVPADTSLAGWPLGQVRLVLADGLALSVERVSDTSWTIHSRSGITADRLAGKPSKLRVRRGTLP